MISIAFLTAVALTAEFPQFLPPPSGIGAELRPLSVRSIGMGGASSGIEDETALCFANPAASAWAGATGVTWSAAVRNGDDESRDGKMSFPSISVLFPLPRGLVFSAGIAERSRLMSEERMSISGYRATFDWDGGLTEAMASLSLRANDWLAFSLGGRGTFGSIHSVVSLRDPDGGSEAPVATEYVDDALFRPAWGLAVGAFANSGPVDIGIGMVTDRRGTLDVDRDFAGGEPSASDTEHFEVPGEIDVGLGVHPTGWMTLAADLLSRKSFTIPGGHVPSGSIASLGAEASFGNAFCARAGFSSMDGLWRDGSRIYSLGAGYEFGRGSAGLDIAVTREEADDFEETGFYISLFASENWIGR
jgi:hypothetical protein